MWKARGVFGLTERAVIGWKWLASFARAQWRFADYPKQVYRIGTAPPGGLWAARFLNWEGPRGVGATRDEALADLRRQFEEILSARRLRGEPLPRPGTSVPLRFAAQAKVGADPDLLRDFMVRVLGFSARTPVFVSDESSLHDFGGKPQVEEYRERIMALYGVDVSDLPGLLIADILARIDRR